jgi:CDGSH-type Zn-finger protein/truncated hemoglobin YjbI
LCIVVEGSYMPDISPDSQESHTVETREDVITLLSLASEYEQRVACATLFAAYSLKNDSSEGGLIEAQASQVRGWRRQLAAAAVNRTRHLAQLANLQTALGGIPSLGRPTFPTSVSGDSSGMSGFTLEPFSPGTIDRLITYEHPDTVVAVSGQPAGTNGTSPPSGSFETLTVGRLYEQIAEGLRALSAEELFIGPADAQAAPKFLNLGGPLLAVTNLESAQAAVAAIAEKDQAESDGLSTIRNEYATAVADAAKAGQEFVPVRAVVANPRTHLSATDAANGTALVEPLTVAVADLFSEAYGTMLRLLSRFFAHTEESDSQLELLEQASQRLIASVLRPLGDALAQLPVDNATLPGTCAGAPFGNHGTTSESIHQASAWALFNEQLWHQAMTATKLSLVPGLPSEIKEATAALQDLAVQFAPTDGPHNAAARVDELRHIEAELPRGIQASLNGPYLATNVDDLVNWLGEHIPTRPQMAFCRCGGSALKPFCDGTHARIDFTGQKDPSRVADRHDTYQGTAVTVFDNRGICAHSGFCTDRLSGVFRAHEDEFVVPSGARMDDIVRAVRACPSGALSYTFGEVEDRDGVDQIRPPAVEVSKDGPYRITGGIPLTNGEGEDEPRNTGVSREHYSLCRCGHSQNKPFCSGMHWYVNFHDPQADGMEEPTLFEWAGGLPGLTRMTHLFYDKYVPQDPLLQPLFAHMSPDHPQRVAAWLGEVFGGPKTYTENYGDYFRMLSQHIGKHITENLRSRWATLISQAADEAGLPADPEFRSAFSSYIEWGSRLAVENSTPDSHPPLNMPIPKWDWGVAGPPGSRVSALAPVEEAVTVVTLPTESEPIHYDQHIKQLFRQMDRQSMKWAFDLWLYDDVVKHAAGILQRLKAGSMPCDGAWSDEKIAVFQRWIDAGKHK